MDSPYNNEEVVQGFNILTFEPVLKEMASIPLNETPLRVTLRLMNTTKEVLLWTTQ